MKLFNYSEFSDKLTEQTLPNIQSTLAVKQAKPVVNNKEDLNRDISLEEYILLNLQKNSVGANADLYEKVVNSGLIGNIASYFTAIDKDLLTDISNFEFRSASTSSDIFLTANPVDANARTFKLLKPGKPGTIETVVTNIDHLIESINAGNLTPTRPSLATLAQRTITGNEDVLYVRGQAASKNVLHLLHNFKLGTTAKSEPKYINIENIVGGDGKELFQTEKAVLLNPEETITKLITGIKAKLEEAKTKYTADGSTLAISKITITSSASNAWNKQKVPATNGTRTDVPTLSPAPSYEEKNNKLAYDRGIYFKDLIKPNLTTLGLGADINKVNVDWQIADSAGFTDTDPNRPPGTPFGQFVKITIYLTISTAQFTLTASKHSVETINIIMIKTVDASKKSPWITAFWMAQSKYINANGTRKPASAIRKNTNKPFRGFSNFWSMVLPG